MVEYVVILVNNKINNLKLDTHYDNVNDSFEEFIIDRAKRILNCIENETVKKITDRNIEYIIKYFGDTLEKLSNNNKYLV